jgi:hypothetical protein
MEALSTDHLFLFLGDFSDRVIRLNPRESGLDQFFAMLKVVRYKVFIVYKGTTVGFVYEDLAVLDLLIAILTILPIFLEALFKFKVLFCAFGP